MISPSKRAAKEDFLIFEFLRLASRMVHHKIYSKNNKIIYLDGPGGTQVPIQVINNITKFIQEH